MEQVDAELAAAATRVTPTPTEAKQLLDIIAAITIEGQAADASTPIPSQQTPSQPVHQVCDNPAKEKAVHLKALLQQPRLNQNGPDRCQPRNLPQPQLLSPAQ